MNNNKPHSTHTRTENHTIFSYSALVKEIYLAWALTSRITTFLLFNNLSFVEISAQRKKEIKKQTPPTGSRPPQDAWMELGSLIIFVVISGILLSLGLLYSPMMDHSSFQKKLLC